MKKFHVAELVGKVETGKNSGLFMMNFRIWGISEIKVLPGQFMVLAPVSLMFKMPRPFSIAYVEQNIVTIFVKVVGENTRAYAEMPIYSKIKVTLPQGAPIALDPVGESYTLVAGGFGSAALMMLAEHLLQQGKKVKIWLGAKKASQIAGLDFFLLRFDAEVITEKRKDDHQTGLVTDFLASYLANEKVKSIVIACGPKPMLREVAKICAWQNCACQVILETVMACGMGACLGCVIPCVSGPNKHACSDGPAFDAKIIDWPLFAPDSREGIITPIIKAQPEAIDLSVSLAGINLKSPIIAASGTFSHKTITEEQRDLTSLGAIVTKGISLHPRAGNPGPRVCETAAGMLNSIGLENPGIDSFIKEYLPIYASLGIPVIVNILGDSIAEFEEITERLSGVAGVAGIEVNISCPNVKKGGAAFGSDPAMAAAVTMAVKKRSDVPVLVKLSPNVADIAMIARAVEDVGADGITLINTLIGMAIDAHTRRFKLGNKIGGLSGAAIKPVALRMVYQVSQAVTIPVVGIGGIENCDDVAEFILAGASSVQIGTGNFANPMVYTETEQGLREIISANGYSSLREFIGQAI